MPVNSQLSRVALDVHEIGLEARPRNRLIVKGVARVRSYLEIARAVVLETSVKVDLAAAVDRRVRSDREAVVQKARDASRKSRHRIGKIHSLVGRQNWRTPNSILAVGPYPNESWREADVNDALGGSVAVVNSSGYLGGVFRSENRCRFHQRGRGTASGSR